MRTFVPILLLKELIVPHSASKLRRPWLRNSIQWKFRVPQGLVYSKVCYELGHTGSRGPYILVLLRNLERFDIGLSAALLAA